MHNGPNTDGFPIDFLAKTYRFSTNFLVGISPHCKKVILERRWAYWETISLIIFLYIQEKGIDNYCIKYSRNIAFY